MVDPTGPADLERSARLEGVRPEGLPSRNRGLANVTCVGAAAVGALMWAGVTSWADGESGVFAIVIGVLVGGSCMLVGGRGSQMAVIASVFTCLSIFGGKMIAAERAIAAEFEVAAREGEHVTFEAWSTEQVGSRTVQRRMLYSLHGLDLLSAAVGIAIAFMIVMRASRADVARMQAAG